MGHICAVTCNCLDFLGLYDKVGPSLNADRLLMLLSILYNRFLIKFLLVNDAEVAWQFC